MMKITFFYMQKKKFKLGQLIITEIDLSNGTQKIQWDRGQEFKNPLPRSHSNIHAF